jgi:phosphate:Na+ symporter
MTILAELLAGLGLLFVGLRLLSQHLRQAVGRRVRAGLRLATTSRWGGLLSGVLAGAVTQSGNAVTLIASNLVRSRALSVGQAIPVVAGANAGTALLVFLASVEMRLIVLYLIAVSGLSLHFKLDRNALRRHWLWAGMGLALLFLGMDFIKHAPASLAASDWQHLLGGGLSAGTALLLGLVLAVVTQSSSAATVLAVATLHSGSINLDTGFWITAGANLGSGIAIFISGSDLKGSGRQLCIVQVLVKIVGTLAVLLAWVFCFASRAALADPRVLAGQSATLLALLFLAMQVAGALPAALLRDQVLALTARFTAADPAEVAGRPHYIHDEAVDDAINALELAVLERRRLLAALPALLPDLDRRAADVPTARRDLWAGHRDVVDQTAAFLTAVISSGQVGDDMDRALHEQVALESLGALQDTLHEFSDVVDEDPQQVAPLIFTLSESLLTLTGLLADTVRPGTDKADALQDVEMLIALTADRGDLLERVRRGLIPGPAQTAAETRRLLLATRLFDRAVWLIRRLAINRNAEVLAAPAQAAGAAP